MSAPTILVTDDDEAIREVVQMTLEIIAGWSVLTAASGAEAVEVARAHQPDAVLMDMMMPGMNGLEATAALAADESTRHIPVVLLTAKAQVDDAPGVQGVIAKPFAARELPAQVAELLGWPAP